MPNGTTIKERLTRIETLLENHLAHQAARDKWMMGVLSGLVVGIILLALRLYAIS